MNTIDSRFKLFAKFAKGSNTTPKHISDAVSYTHLFCFDCAEFKTKMSLSKLKAYEKVRLGE